MMVRGRGWILRGAGLVFLMLTSCGRVVSERPTPTQVFPSVQTGTPMATPVVVRVPTATPIPTPTLSPTPIIYVVQPGDTLYGIALKYGVSVSALQETNGITDPKLLQVGQRLVIPAPRGNGRGTESPRLPTPTPMPLLVQGFRCTTNALGSLSCVGEVINPQPLPMQNVQVQIVLRDGEGRELGVGIAGTALEILASGGRSPFALVFATIPAGYAQAEAQVVRAEPTQEPGRRYGPVGVARAQGGEEGVDFVVRGQARNADAVPLRRINVVVAFYDGQDRLLGFRQVVFSQEPTLPGATRDFEARFPVTDVRSFRVFAEGQR